MLSHQIPYHITNGLNFYGRREVKILLDYLRFISKPLSDEGDEALEQIINVPNRYIGRKFMADLRKKATKNNLHLYEELRSMFIKIPYIRRSVDEFKAFIEPLIEDRTLTPAELISLLRECLDYDRAITEEDIPSPDDNRIQNIDQLQMSAGKFKAVESFLLYADRFEESPSANDESGVSLMTVHKAKGLEFPVVFIVGLVQGILPSHKGDIEEERRVAFVAMSRAMKLLYLCHSQNYLGQPSKRSVFVEEAIGIKQAEPIQTAA
jgi:DNA helicase-2/ATP-dependent DNA helicase PcrA